MALNHTALPQDERLPHYLRDEDPFASKLSWEADLVAGFYLTIIGILSTFGNGYVLYMSSRRKKKLRPAEIMTINLAVCDLGISVVGKPFTIISCFCHRWVFGWFGCRWYGWAGFFFGCGSLITMTAVSLDRYLKICYLSYVLTSGAPQNPSPNLLPPVLDSLSAYWNVSMKASHSVTLTINAYPYAYARPYEAMSQSLPVSDALGWIIKS
ncbi:opsin-5 isoform X2 [Mus musculus]|uniref:opsin-5 isoform X2 n=1 Tax=Mus musculus TaxID=10090 RepID=UPI0003D707F6|nr:opsin-5 isoform X2 [Mus musculus]|eukprot:XP_017173007.1 PREDICTED: opsin-5 isoform X2 [Mus musculus]